MDIYNDAKLEIYTLGSLDIDISVDKDSKPKSPFIIHTSTKIDSKTGKGEDHSLRDIEYASKGWKFDCKIHFELMNDDKFDKVKKLLNYGINNLKFWGGSRRRGYGSIKTVIPAISKNNFTESDLNLKGNIFQILFELQDDVTIGGAGQTGNHIHTLDYLSGTSVLGMFRNILLKTKQPESTVFMDGGNVEVTNFYPTSQEILDHKIVIPVPSSLRKKKPVDQYRKLFQDKRGDDESKEIPHWLIDVIPKNTDKKNFRNIANQDTLIETKETDETGVSDKSISGEYLIFDDYKAMKTETAVFFKPKKELVMRNSITPETQSTDDNALFTQDMIKKGTKFVGYLKFKNDKSSKDFVTVYEDWITGKYNFHTGRGGKPVLLKEIKSISEIPQPRISELEVKGKKNQFTITLLSDTILYDDNVMAETVLHPKHISKTLRLKIKKEPEKSDVVLKNHISANRIHQSFSGLAGLRRFSDRVVSKGSCFLYELHNGKTISDVKNDLIKLQNEGIGFKKDEGFGRIVVNLSVHDFQKNDKELIQTFKLSKIEISDFYRDDLTEKNKLISEATKLIPDEFKYKGSTFTNRIISYMEAEYPAQEIDIEIKRSIDKKQMQKITGKHLRNISGIN